MTIGVALDDTIKTDKAAREARERKLRETMACDLTRELDIRKHLSDDTNEAS